MSRFFELTIDKTTEEFYAQIAEEGTDLVVIPVDADELYTKAYRFGDGVSITTSDGSVWLGDISDHSDYFVDDRDGFVQCPAYVCVDLM